MKFLMVTDASGSKAALGLGGELARLAHAQVRSGDRFRAGEAAERRSQGFATPRVRPCRLETAHAGAADEAVTRRRSGSLATWSS